MGEKRRLLYVGPYGSRGGQYVHCSWSARFASCFMRLGWDVTLFPYRQVFAGEPLYRVTGGRIACRASAHLHRAFLAACDATRPHVIFLEKAEQILPASLQWAKVRNPLSLIAFYCPDDPQLFEHLGRSTAEVSDVVLTSSEACVRMYQEMGLRHAEYMPFWGVPAPPPADPVPPPFQSDIAFVGTYYPERGMLLKEAVPRLDHLGVRLRIWGSGWEAAPSTVRERCWMGGPITCDEQLRMAFQGCKIALNMHHVFMKYGGMKSNIRTYEAMANRACVLSDRPVGIEDLFAVGEELVCYDSADDLVARAEDLLRSPSERERIAARGYEAIQQRYTMDHWAARANAVIMAALQA